YVGLNFANWQVSFGKQSLWWSPTQGGPLMFSDNADPVNMFRISRVSPFKLPWILGWLGPMRLEWFLGQLDGHQFVFQTDTGIVGQFGRPLDRQPFLQGQKISLKPTRNFEFSVSSTTVFAGGPGALTWHTFLRSYSLGNTLHGGDVGDPGDRRSGVDFSYRIPGMRNWLTFYGDAFTEDEFSPLGYPRKSAIRGGVYMPRIPGFPKLDLRLEGGSTVPPDFSGCNGCFYVNGHYPDGSYLNLGSLVGSWLGRAGQGEQVWSTYWLSSRNKIQFQFRHQKVDGDYLPQGGT
ncbi:MAG: capsule assembly Wzi family protein, partial [Acidobacteria bacterium]